MKKQILFEDTVSQYNKWVSGQASREFNAQRLKFSDLFDRYGNAAAQDINNAKVTSSLPYQVVNAVNIISNLDTNISNAVNEFKSALEHPRVKQDKQAHNKVLEILNSLSRAQAELKNIATRTDTSKS